MLADTVAADFPRGLDVDAVHARREAFGHNAAHPGASLGVVGTQSRIRSFGAAFEQVRRRVRFRHGVLGTASAEPVHRANKLETYVMGVLDRFVPGVVEAPCVGPENHEPIQAGLGEVVYVGLVDRYVPGMV